MDCTIALIFHPYLDHDSEKRGESLYYMVGTKFREISRLITNKFWPLLNRCKKANKYFYFLWCAKMVTRLQLHFLALSTHMHLTQHAEQHFLRIRVQKTCQKKWRYFMYPWICYLICHHLRSVLLNLNSCFEPGSWNIFLPLGATTDLFPFTGERRSGGIFIAMWHFQPNASVNLNWG